MQFYVVKEFFRILGKYYLEQFTLWTKRELWKILSSLYQVVKKKKKNLNFKKKPFLVFLFFGKKNTVIVIR